ncbi:HAMP domain-containing sensor histidine kinase [Sphingopyxis sp.]|uniref:sensor histidine kinase n=1 Tax=Sphingopyxis sp. TaxID=1908224 RepID=UPI001DE44E26|nr:HAMP domain-containing sensor histidine kinase [Sphingopyxis sp.]MBW8294495.1 HAMP domain-containing histidine kinase [Sphingopyxis sp.]
MTSLRGRFLLSILLWVTIGIGAIWYSAISLFTAHVEDLYHEELEVHVRELAGLTQLDVRGNPRLSRPLSDPRYAVPLSGFYWQVTREGYVTLKSGSMTRGSLDDGIARSPEILHRIEAGPSGPTIAYGAIKKTAGAAPLQFIIATDQRHLQRIISNFTQELSIWLMLLACALIGSGLAIITFGLKPFARLARAITDLHSGKTGQLEGVFPDEIQLVVANLNAYANGNAAIVERGRVQAGNLAHSLRTPLAVTTDEAERMLENDAASKSARVFLAESERMQRQIDYHLARTRSGGSRHGVGLSAKLMDAVPPLIAAMKRLHPSVDFHVKGNASHAPQIACDPEDLSEILSNLLDNAGKWANAVVEIGYELHGDAVDLTVTDDGPGIAPSQYESVFAIGATLDDPRCGSGLGLAIARDIARDYGGDLTLAAARDGGLLARVTIPTPVGRT